VISSGAFREVKRVPRNGKGWKQILKREVSRLLAWIALFVVLLIYPLLLLALSGIALYQSRRAARDRAGAESAGGAPSP
jgi:hypothetical protein